MFENDHFQNKISILKEGELAQMAARSASDWKILSSNPAGSINENSNSKYTPYCLCIFVAEDHEL